MELCIPSLIPVNNPGQSCCIPTAYQAVWKTHGFGTKESLKGLREEDLTNMKFLLSDVRKIMAQLELLFAPVALPAFVAPVVPVIGRIRPAWNTKNMNAMESKDPST